jgi:ATP-dependent DNA ligase
LSPSPAYLVTLSVPRAARSREAGSFFGTFRTCRDSLTMSAHRGKAHDDGLQFYAFDCMVSDGNDLRKLPLSMRKTNLARLLARRGDGIFLSDFEQGEIGPDLFRHACLLGLEGLVSKIARAAIAAADRRIG